MLFSVFLFSPLEPFIVQPTIYDDYEEMFHQFIFSNIHTILLLVITSTFFLFIALTKKNRNAIYYLKPTSAQYIWERIFSVVAMLLIDNVKLSERQYYYPLLFSMFFCLLMLNGIGLQPFSFSITSHFIATISMSLTMFVATYIIGYLKHGNNIFSHFLPQGTVFPLGFLLVGVELISFIFKPLSLATRVFCNMMAGHTLLTIFIMFSWDLLDEYFGLPSFLVIIIITLLLLLETAVVLIQSYVYCLLTTIYLNEALKLH